VNFDLGKTVLLAPRRKHTHCRPGAPDRACSPGAYYAKLTRQVICSPEFRTSAIRDVPDSERFAAEAAYGLKPGHYGKMLEIDHIIPLELGGSNDIANLFPENLHAAPGYRLKDRLENKFAPTRLRRQLLPPLHPTSNRPKLATPLPAGLRNTSLAKPANEGACRRLQRERFATQV